MWRSRQQAKKILNVVQYPAITQINTKKQFEKRNGNNFLALYGKDAVVFTVSAAVDNNDGVKRSSPDAQLRVKLMRAADNIGAYDSNSSQVNLKPSEWAYDKCNNMIRHFVPANHPQSVAAGYDGFALYSFLASIAGSASMVLSTQVSAVRSGPVQNV